jgi:peroxiredoxin
MITKRRSAAALVVALAASLSCTPPDAGGPRIDAPAPEYGGVTLQGDSVSLASFEGQVVLLNLWATWCAPCRHETPFLQSIYETHREQGLEIVGISLDTGNSQEAVAEFVSEYEVTYTILLDPQMRGYDIYQVFGLPATYLLDREGTVRWMRIGPVSETDTDFLTALEAVLG